MDNRFRVNILTPKRQFISDDFEAVVFMGLDGEICILKDHMPMLSAVDMGIIRLKNDGGWRKLITDRGWAEINSNTLNIFSNMCEWAENIENVKEEIKRLRFEERESVRRHRINVIGLTRTVSDFGKSGKRNKI